MLKPQFPEKSQHVAHRELIDLEEKMRRKFLAKCRFRALVRRVMANKYWLMELDDEEYEGDNVKKRVVQAMRTKSKKKKALFSLKDKALLNKPASERTEAEKKYIYRKIGGLKCFKRYPNHVKKKLAAATYFVYYGPNRVIVRQNQDAHALYFVVTGQVVVSIQVFDELLKQYNSVDVFVMTPGDMFGEVSLLHDINRTATCTTSAHCEFLALMKDDFKSILKVSLMKQWEEVIKAMSAFNYFDTLDEVARREGCIVAKMKRYEANETMLGDGAGMPNFVYFVLSGQCQMIETLQIGVTKRRDKKFYTLYDPFIDQEETELDLEKKYFSDSSRISQVKHPSDDSAAHKSEGLKIPGASKGDVSEELVILAKNESVLDNENQETTVKIKTDETVKKSSFKINKQQEEEDHKANSRTKKTSIAKRSSIRIDVPEEETEASSSEIRRKVSNVPRKSQGTESNVPLNILKNVSQDYQDSGRQSQVWNVIGKPQPDFRTYFMQVCIFRPGSTFGFGENMRDRRIVALTPVDCMLLPKVWLLQKNTANIWSRIQHYLEKKIPTKKQLFKEFVTQRRWQEAREEIVVDVVKRSKTINYTTIHDVPYSIRMEEMHDI